ncbi:hypothetical protein TrispH2_000262 [Trichoplax sp. H2]|nr:hypothetical protein TrispH2_000262 [Trichoplax sp. H2]|eukprot:RDD47393.1 hypothetical protein TrispH2_000262 [Trichoplax sp. H2]
MALDHVFYGGSHALISCMCFTMMAINMALNVSKNANDEPPVTGLSLQLVTQSMTSLAAFACKQHSKVAFLVQSVIVFNVVTIGAAILFEVEVLRFWCQTEASDDSRIITLLIINSVFFIVGIVASSCSIKKYFYFLKESTENAAFEESRNTEVNDVINPNFRNRPLKLKNIHKTATARLIICSSLLAAMSIMSMFLNLHFANLPGLNCVLVIWLLVLSRFTQTITAISLIIFSLNFLTYLTSGILYVFHILISTFTVVIVSISCAVTTRESLAIEKNINITEWRTYVTHSQNWREGNLIFVYRAAISSIVTGITLSIFMVFQQYILNKYYGISLNFLLAAFALTSGRFGLYAVYSNTKSIGTIYSLFATQTIFLGIISFSLSIYQYFCYDVSMPEALSSFILTNLGIAAIVIPNVIGLLKISNQFLK